MKGPYERLKYDLRRLWECPACKRRERTDGATTFRFCACGTKQEAGRPVVMKLIEDGPRRVVPPAVIHHRELPPLSATPVAAPVVAEAPPVADAPAIEPK